MTTPTEPTTEAGREHRRYLHAIVYGDGECREGRCECHADILAIEAEARASVPLDAPLEIPSYDGRLTAYLGQGDDCVLVQITESGRLLAGIVLTPDGAETMARSLNKRAEYARLTTEGADR